MLESVIETVVGGFFYLTGECIRWCFTLGAHKVRWWDSDDQSQSWSSLLLGLAFWLGLGGLLWLALR